MKMTACEFCAGRLSYMLANQTPALQTILGPPQGWQAALLGTAAALPKGSGPLRGAAAGRAGGKSPDEQQYKQLQHMLRSAAMHLLSTVMLQRQFGLFMLLLLNACWHRASLTEVDVRLNKQRESLT